MFLSKKRSRSRYRSVCFLERASALSRVREQRAKYIWRKPRFHAGSKMTIYCDEEELLAHAVGAEEVSPRRKPWESVWRMQAPEGPHNSSPRKKIAFLKASWAVATVRQYAERWSHCCGAESPFSRSWSADFCADNLPPIPNRDSRVQIPCRPLRPISEVPIRSCSFWSSWRRSLNALQEQRSRTILRPRWLHAHESQVNSSVPFWDNRG